MKTGLPVAAIFDIGKTNKKFLLFDKEYQIVYETDATFENIEDEDGDACENLHALTGWMKQVLDDALFNQTYHIKALNFTAYGASFVHLDKRGIPVTPLYSYLKNYPENLLKSFYHKYGNKESIAVNTASPPLGMLNSGLQLYWLKHQKPEVFKKIKYSLHLPQYCSYLFTNKAFSEITSIGCHTALWDFKKKGYHTWVNQEKLTSLFPPMSSTTTKLDIPLGKHKFCAGIGIHDSSASLIPFSHTELDPFMVLSTGTWNITFNSFNDEPLTLSDLDKDCLAFLNTDGKPVKASRLFLGYEHTYYTKKIATFFGKTPQYHKSVKFDKGLTQKLLYENNFRKKFLPHTMEVGKYLSFSKHKAVDLSLFESFEEAYHQLNIDLVALQAMSIETAIGNTSVRKIYITGGFCENPIFIYLLASRFPDIEIYAASMREASALGAALLMHSCWNTKDISIPFDVVQYHPHKDIAILEYELI